MSNSKFYTFTVGGKHDGEVIVSDTLDALKGSIISDWEDDAEDNSTVADLLTELENTVDFGTVSDIFDELCGILDYFDWDGVHNFQECSTVIGEEKVEYIIVTPEDTVTDAVTHSALMESIEEMCEENAVDFKVEDFSSLTAINNFYGRYSDWEQYVIAVD